MQTLPEGVDVQALIDLKKAEQQKLEEQGNYKEAIPKEEQFRERSAAKDKEIEELKSKYESWNLFPPPYKPWRK